MAMLLCSHFFCLVIHSLLDNVIYDHEECDPLSFAHVFGLLYFFYVSDLWNLNQPS